MRSFPTSLIVGIACTLACGGSGSNQTGVKDPPKVFIDVPNKDTIGTELDVLVSINGCASVSQAAILDHGNQIATFTPASAADGGVVNPTPVALQTNQIPYSTGITAHLSLTASATCDDGRKNTSQPQAADYFPVAKVYKTADGSSVVPAEFYAEGSGASVTFVGCDAANKLVRVNTSGQVLKSVTMPNGCALSSWFSDHTANGVRWMITPVNPGGGPFGAVAFRDVPGQPDDLTLSAKALDGAGDFINVLNLGVGADGDAIVLGTSGANPDWIFRIAHDNLTSGNTAPLWTKGSEEADLPPASGRAPQGNPVVSGSEFYFPAHWGETTQTASNTHWDVEHRNYDGGVLLSNPVEVQSYSGGPLDPELSLAMTMSSDGLFVNFSFNDGSTAGTFDTVQASSIDGSRRLTATGMLGSALAAIPFAAGETYVAAIGSQHTYFFKPPSSTTVNLGGVPIDTTGSLTTFQIQPGKTADFYLLNGDPQSTAVPNLPVEVVGVDTPENGELFRYDVNGGNLAVAVDDSGQVWLRVGNDLAQLLSTNQYRSLRSP